MTLSNQIRELAERQRAAQGFSAKRNVSNELTWKLNLNLPTILAALELAERLEAPGCVEEVALVSAQAYFGRNVSEEYIKNDCTGGYIWRQIAQAAISAMKGEK